MLTDRTIKAAKPKAAAYLVSDGKGLALKVQPGGSRSWVLRYQTEGKPHVLGLGSYPEITLSDAREKALEARRLRASGTDPVEYKARQKATAVLTFDEVAKRYIEAHEAGWRSAKSLVAWQMTLREYAGPVLGAMPVGAILPADVLRVLTPIWSRVPETAGRVRGRIEAVLDYAKVIGQRTGENPAAWRGNLALTLPKRSKVAAVEHHASLPYAELPAFLADLRQRGGLAARCLEFVILTAARTGEAIGATWPEIDLEGRLWAIPGSRMKGGRDHVVPLARISQTG
jgi:integrase